jgi:hypothetical protein
MIFLIFDLHQKLPLQPVSQGCYKEWCYKGVAKVLQGCYKGVTKVFQAVMSGVHLCLVQHQELPLQAVEVLCIRHHHLMLEGCYKGVTKVLRVLQAYDTTT